MHMPMARAFNLYLFMLYEWADKETREDIDAALRPPLTWRDPATGLPAGWADDDEAIWAEWEAAMS